MIPIVKIELQNPIPESIFQGGNELLLVVFLVTAPKTSPDFFCMGVLEGVDSKPAKRDSGSLMVGFILLIVGFRAIFVGVAIEGI